MFISILLTDEGVPTASLTTALTMFVSGQDTNDSVADLAVSGVSGSNGTLGSVGSNLPTLVVDQLVYVSGGVQAGNNGLWKITTIVTAGDEVTAAKQDGLTPVNETSFAAVLGETPTDAPMADQGDGYYYYEFTTYDKYKNYVYVIDGDTGGLTLAVDADRYKEGELSYYDE